MVKRKKIRKKVARNRNVHYTKPMTIKLTNDIIFKYVFGAKGSEPILLSLINAVLTDSGFTPIVSLSIQNPVMPKATNWLKGTVLDIRAQDDGGIEYDIEMQVNNEPNFKNRSLYYWAKQYASQLEGGEEYVTLKPVICINLINFSIIDSTEAFHSCFMLYEKNIKDIQLTQDLQIHFVELPKAQAFKGKLAEWAQLLQTPEWATEEQMTTLLNKDGYFEKTYERYRTCLLDKRAYHDAISREMWLHDQASRIGHSRREGLQQGLQEGLQQGLQEGLQQGLQEGLQQGLQQGLQEGARKNALETAQKLRKLGSLSTEQIANITGLSVEEVEAIE